MRPRSLSDGIPPNIATIYNVIGSISADPRPATRDAGSVDEWVEELTAAVLDHRTAGFLHHRINDPAPEDITIGRWIHEVVPKVREAIQQT